MLSEEEAKFVRAAISLSGLFRLEPVMLSFLNDSIGMDRENALNNSSVFLNPAGDCRLLLATGTDESDEFKAQGEELYNNWKSKCSHIEYLEVPQKNHYSILDTVIENDSTLWAAILRLMNIDPEYPQSQ